MTNAKSIHIGLNHVDPDCYNGWDGALAGCINDANDMQSIADGLGYQSMTLIDSTATADRVIAEIGQVATELQPGDILFLSYSGHGGQVDDVNGDEDEGLDETWVLWDRQLIDDELFALWSQFQPGVRIVVLSDSCHSGTVARMLATAKAIDRELKGTKGAKPAELVASLSSLNRTLGVNGAASGNSDGRRSKRTVSRAASLSAAAYRSAGSTEMRAAVPPGATKRIPPDIQDLVNAKQASRHAAAQFIAGPAERASVNASVILISGCQDEQLSSDGSANGLFTEKLKQVWDDGGFSGDYRDFWQSIKGLMPARQQPNYLFVGAANPGFEGQNPFEIANGSGGSVSPVPTPIPTPQPNPDPTPGGPRPTLKVGARGEHVTFLQTRLQDNGFNVDVDGDFGLKTLSAVRAFQRANGLDADGVVGPATWEALG